MALAEEQGVVQYVVGGLEKPCQTWYKVIGDLKRDSPPLFILHGGPGASPEYLLPLADLAPSAALVFCDQIGNGKSTHLPEKMGDQTFWTIKLFLDELNSLIRQLGLAKRQIDLYAHSLGSCFAVEWSAIEKKLSISSLRDRMPDDHQNILDEGDETGDFEKPEYQAAMEVFHKRHASLARPWPCKEGQEAICWLDKDPTTYDTMYGPSELVVSGSLRDWTSIPLLSKIKAPEMLIHGAQDEAQTVAMQPFFDHIPRVKWVTLDNAAHFSHVDQRENYMQHLATFLRN